MNSSICSTSSFSFDEGIRERIEGSPRFLFFIPSDLSHLRTLDGPVRLCESTSTPISPYSSAVDERANTSRSFSLLFTHYLPFIPPAQPDRRSDRIPERIQPSVRNLIKTTRLWMQFEHARCDERRGSFHVVLVISNLLFRYTPLLLSPNPLSISSTRYVCVFVLRARRTFLNYDRRAATLLRVRNRGATNQRRLKF